MKFARRTFTLALLASTVGIMACDSSPPKMVPTDLSAQGIPVTISAPEGAEVKDTMLTIAEKGLDVRKSDFMVTVEMYAEPTGADPKTVTTAQHDMVAKDPDFSKFLLEEDHGYIYSKKAEGGEAFHFFYVSHKDGKEFQFVDALNLFDDHKEADIKTMYNSVKQ